LQSDEGSLLFAETASNVVITFGEFEDNVARSGGGVVYVKANSVVELKRCVLVYNSAREGGVGFVSGDGSKLVVRSGEVKGNRATFGGGAFKMVMGRLELWDVTVDGNKAQSGGAVSALRAEMLSTNVTMHNNTASANGGALSFSLCSHKELSQLRHTYFNYNVADDTGGAIHIDACRFMIENCTLSNNSAVEGGAIWNVHTTLTADSSVAISHSAFVGNTASVYGGAIFTTAPNNLAFTPRTARHLYNTTNPPYYEWIDSSGGNAHRSKIIFSIANTVFTHNHAVKAGGALASKHSSPLSMTNSTLLRNKALHGGGLWFSQATSMELSGLRLIENNAIAGGAIFGDSTDYVGCSSCNFTLNEGTAYGNEKASYTREVAVLDDINTGIAEYVKGNEPFTFNITVLDYYGQRVFTDNETQCTVTISNQYIIYYTCMDWCRNYFFFMADEEGNLEPKYETRCIEQCFVDVERGVAASVNGLITFADMKIRGPLDSVATYRIDCIKESVHLKTLSGNTTIEGIKVTKPYHEGNFTRTLKRKQYISASLSSGWEAPEFNLTLVDHFGNTIKRDAEDTQCEIHATRAFKPIMRIREDVLPNKQCTDGFENEGGNCWLKCDLPNRRCEST
jgi:hypothetical protein